MKLSLIVATSRNGVIGRSGKLPWDKIPEDVANFRRLTMGHAVIMGRKTFDSLPEPLAARRNVVLSGSTPYFRSMGTIVARTPADAILGAYVYARDEAFVIGGESIYRLFAPLCDEAHITIVDEVVSGDAMFDKAWLSGVGETTSGTLVESRKIAEGATYLHWVRKPLFIK